jgi:hypothetical protein
LGARNGNRRHQRRSDLTPNAPVTPVKLLFAEKRAGTALLVFRAAAVTSNGHALGTLCVIGNEARSFTEAELDLLRGLAKKAIARIEERRKGLPATPG